MTTRYPSPGDNLMQSAAAAWLLLGGGSNSGNGTSGTSTTNTPILTNCTPSTVAVGQQPHPMTSTTAFAAAAAAGLTGIGTLFPPLPQPGSALANGLSAGVVNPYLRM